MRQYRQLGDVAPPHGGSLARRRRFRGRAGDRIGDGPVRRRRGRRRAVRRCRRYRDPLRHSGRAGDRHRGPGAIGRRGRGGLRRVRSARARRRRGAQRGGQRASPAHRLGRSGRRRDPASRLAAPACRIRLARAPSRPGPGMREPRSGAPYRRARRAGRRNPRSRPGGRTGPRPVDGPRKRRRTARHAEPGVSIRRASESRLPTTRRSPSSIRMWRRVGGAGAPRSSASRRSTTSRRRRTATAAGFRGDIPSCMPAESRPPAGFCAASLTSPSVTRCMASAAATWCWAGRWRTPTARSIEWQG